MAYPISKPLVTQKFPISDYIRLAIMGMIILLTIIVIKIGEYLSNETGPSKIEPNEIEMAPATKDRPFPEKNCP